MERCERKEALNILTLGKYSPCSRKKWFFRDMYSFYFIFKRLRKYVTFDEASTLKAHVFFSIILFETLVKFWSNLLIHKCDYNV
jgi:hypothetical protein